MESILWKDIPVFRRSCQICHFRDSEETEGVAVEQMMAVGIPLVVTNNETLLYFSDNMGVTLSQDKPLDTTVTTPQGIQ